MAVLPGCLSLARLHSATEIEAEVEVEVVQMLIARVGVNLTLLSATLLSTMLLSDLDQELIWAYKLPK